MPTCLEIDIELTSAKKAHDNILESLQLVMREMVDAPCDGELRAQVLIWGNNFVARWAPVTAALEELTSMFKNYHRIHPTIIRSSIETQAEEVRSLVMTSMSNLDFQRSLPPELKRINTALSRIISSASDIYRAIDELRAFVETDKSDPYNGMPYPHWDFNCKKCGEVALEVTMIPADANHPLQNHKEVALLLATRKSSDQEQKSIDASQFEQLSKSLDRSDFASVKEHSSAAYIFCVRCRGLYCWDDWSNKTGVYEDSMYDHTEATCPDGHRQPIDD